MDCHLGGKITQKKKTLAQYSSYLSCEMNIDLIITVPGRYSSSSVVGGFRAFVVSLKYKPIRLHVVCGCFHAAVAKLNSCNSDCVVCKT